MVHRALHTSGGLHHRLHDGPWGRPPTAPHRPTGHHDGVSGGSILAASYALRGSDGPADFEARFLTASLQQELEAAALTPRSLWRIQSPRFGRSDLLAEHLDERPFDGATFADLTRRRRKPFVIIDASDMFNGSRFEFVQDQFDFLCSDLGGVPLARAVAASSAVPILLSPITLWNHSDESSDCGNPPLGHTSRNGDLRRRGAAARRARELPGARPRRPAAPLRAPAGRRPVRQRRCARRDGICRPVRKRHRSHACARLPRGQARRHPRRQRRDQRARRRGSQPRRAGPVAHGAGARRLPINRNSTLTLAHQRAMLEAWEAEVRAAHKRRDFEVYAQGACFHLVEVNLADVPDPTLRERLLSISTTLQLPVADVDALRHEAAAALGRSSAFRRLLTDLSSAPAMR